jgi:hypothetical protein
MAIGKASDFVVRNELFQTLFTETLAQNVAILNQDGNGVIRLVTNDREGDYDKTRFFDRPSGGVSRRDTTDTSTSLTPSALTQDEVIGVKLNRKYGPYQQTRDAFKKIGGTPEDLTMILAPNMAEEAMKGMVNDAVAALVAALRNNAGVVYDYAATGSNKTIDHTALIRGRALFGDAFGRVKGWGMNGAAFHKLVEAQLSVASGNVGDFAVYEGQAGTLGLPAFVSDAPAFATSGTPGEYHILGLVPNAAVLTVSEAPYMATDETILKENILYAFQGEYAFNLELKGYKWDVANGGANPSDAALATGSNWDKVVANDKDTAGIVIDVDQS